jgi:hypothetical protein
MPNLPATIKIVLYLLTDILAPWGLVNKARQDEDTLLISFLLNNLYTLSIVLVYSKSF